MFFTFKAGHWKDRLPLTALRAGVAALLLMAWVGLPKAWTQIKAVIEIPSGVDSILPALFSWWTKGALYADDFSIEKVDASTPVTPL